LAVLLLVPALADGQATVGDVGLFATAMAVLGTLPRWAASLGAYHRQAEVSVERMARLFPDRDPLGVASPAPLDLRHGPGPFSSPALGAPHERADGERLQVLEVRG